MILVAIGLAAIGAGCGSTGHTNPAEHVTRTHATTPAAARPRPLSGAIKMTFSDTVNTTKCPRSTPADEQCFKLTASTTVPGHGTIRLGPTLDIEAPSSSHQCGATTVFATRLTTTQGVIDVRERGPRLCLQALGAVNRSFQITGGTGRYLHATGAGKVTIIVQAIGATEDWTGHIALRSG